MSAPDDMIIYDVYEPCDIAISNIKGSDYCCIISLISKKKAINLLQYADLTEKIDIAKK